ncbi:coiled-coil domain-containing 58 [Leptinotarsa decemlineata]|uniref:coiled-coil domain-containing 58 n=1 Tax=Leptinotarsa decemlineata TaxID=7539 RepID=UPI000C254ADE|nr:coiled-coil domain-containing protein 58 [Leptinotarsa decemlineata]
MPAAIMECSDFSEFQEALKAMRKPHDVIVSTINTVVPTDSFHADEVAACKSLYENLEEGNIKREKFIKNCISLTTTKVKNLKDQREGNSDDIQLSKVLRAEQTKLRMLQVELSVEDLIKQRTAKVFNERCRRFYKPL